MIGMAGLRKAWPGVNQEGKIKWFYGVLVATDNEFHQEFDNLSETVSEADLVKERRLKERADAARFTYWTGVTLIGVFIVPLINLAPVRVTEPVWQLNLITLLMSNGVWALIGAVLICLARVIHYNDRMIRSRALLLRNLASWVAIGWLLLIPLQVFLSVRLINNLGGREIGEIQNVQRVSRLVSSANTEGELRAAMAQMPNQPPLPRLIVPLEVAKTNILSQMQRNINAAKNRQELRISERWQTWLKESLRNAAQCSLLALGFLALGKKRNLT
ncbi:MAG: hypothetical protein VKO39_01620 [Cyanobacteriota bacterium]|nr:hypothetical protein [Cyanobacteriota bacterium]